jgi:ArsR family transcriptional regulator
MLRVAHENLDYLGVSNAELLVGDLAGLPLADNSVDAAFANMVLHHAVDPVAMLKDMARIVRPGGTIVLTDEVEHSYEWMREEHADVWLGFTPEQVEDFFREAGLADYGMTLLGCSDAFTLRLRARSQTSGSSPPGARSRQDNGILHGG